MTASTATFNTRGFVFETNSIPQGFLRRMEDEGTIALGSRTVEGAYLEPREQLSVVLTRFALAGIDVRKVSPAGLAGCGRRIARPAAETHHRLRSPRAAEWLPTLPAA